MWSEIVCGLRCYSGSMGYDKKYGGNWGCIKDGGRLGSVWWRRMKGIRRGDGMVVRRWFDDNSVKVICDDKNTIFWSNV